MSEVQKLLGPHVGDLKAEEEDSPVQDWISQQRQEDLDTLGLGLQGGIPNGYLVLDLHSRGGPGGLGAASREGGGWRGLSHPSLCRGLLWGVPPPRTRTLACVRPGPVPGFDSELRHLSVCSGRQPGGCCRAPKVFELNKQWHLPCRHVLWWSLGRREGVALGLPVTP